jgi:ssDNA-specific exonuclease RecJ
MKTVEIDNNKVEKLMLKDNIKTSTLEKMSEIFKVLGYFNMDNILKGKASEGFNKVKGIFG